MQLGRPLSHYNVLATEYWTLLLRNDLMTLIILQKE